MSVRLALLLVLLFAVLVAYLTSLNTAGVRVTLGAGWTYDVPLMALLVGAFFAGGAVTSILWLLRDLGRTYHDFRRGRRARRMETASQFYRRGMEAQLAGRSEEAALAYEEVRRLDPAHAEASLRLGELARERGDAQAALDHSLDALGDEEHPAILLRVAEDYRRVGRADDAVRTYRRVLDRDPNDPTALRGLRDVAVEHDRWGEALGAQERLLRAAPRSARAEEDAWRAGIQYELGRRQLAEGDAPGAAGRFREILRARPDFQPAAVALGDIHFARGEGREALRVWERALDLGPAAPLLSRLERLHRAEGRPARMISLYEDALARQPDNLAVAFGLGRVYFELAMLDEAAEQFQKLEVQAPDLDSIHAYLAAIFERHGQVREAFEEYRRALRLPEGFDWPHRCAACGATRASWFDRCPSCRRWNTARP